MKEQIKIALWNKVKSTYPIGTSKHTNALLEDDFDSFIEDVVKICTIPANVSGWRLFNEEKPLDGQRYHYSIGNQFFRGIWSDNLKGFLLDGCGGRYISNTCDCFHACH